jgi:glycerol-3-phosphate dehydrogenase (NAD(P)+)
MGRLAVINAGGWGTALAVLLARSGHNVQLWCRRAELAGDIARTRQNSTYLPGVPVPDGLSPTADLEAALARTDAVILAPISRAMRSTAHEVAKVLRRGTPVLHCSKGLELPSLLRLTQVLGEELSTDRVAVLSGPTHAEEVGRGLPTAAVVASTDSAVAGTFRDLLHGPTFRVYTSSDVVGVELCGALKNVVALATGASDGLGYGDNARAALITRSLAELGRLVHATGGDPRTVAGLAGMGDVVATCTSRHSRNRWAGEQIGRGRSVDEILASTPQVIEGIPATRAAVAFGERYRVELPVCGAVHQVLEHRLSVHDALAQLMGREPTDELPSGQTSESR